MNGEKINQGSEQQENQSTEWDILTDGQFEDIEEVGSAEDRNFISTTVKPTAEMTRRTTKLPWRVENARRYLARRIAPNTMPSMEQIAQDASYDKVGFVQDLCENWPLFAHTEKVTIEGAEIDYPVYRPQIEYTGGTDYVGYLSSPDDPEKNYNQIKSEIGKKNASIIMEATLDNPLVASLTFGVYPNATNSDYIIDCTDSQDLRKSKIRLIDESIPLDKSLDILNSRLTGVEYHSEVEDEKKLEAIDTLLRANITYHEIGHSMDFLENYVKLHERQSITSSEIQEAITVYERDRARDIECSKYIPNTMLKGHYVSEDEKRVILSRRGFDSKYSYNKKHFARYNQRAYREMPCEKIADNYSRKSVCVKHRDHYYAKNEQERQQNPEKENLPIYGQLVYLGEASNEGKNDFLDQELINCGFIAGKKVEIREYIPPEGLTLDKESGLYKLPNDYDYVADQRKQSKQELITDGFIKQNPSDGRFEVVDEHDNLLAVFGSVYHRQQNVAGKIELINGDLSSNDAKYRVSLCDSEEEEAKKREVIQCGSIAFDKYLGIDENKEHSILFINDNSAKRMLLRRGGFALDECFKKDPDNFIGGSMMRDENGDEFDIPKECFIYNGIPKVKIDGELFEVVPGSEEDLRKLNYKIQGASFDKLHDINEKLKKNH